MKYVVQVSYTNPSHEHVSLRRRVESVSRIVEAASEDEALNRAANQQRALGFRIVEAKLAVPTEPPKPLEVISESKKEEMDDEEEKELEDEEEENEEEDEDEDEDEDEENNMKEGIVADMLAMKREKAQKKIADMILKRDIEAAKKERETKRQAGTMKPMKEESEIQYIEEKLTASDPASKWISDFVKSDNPKFAGKTKKERIQMALGAHYAAKRAANEEVEQTDEGYRGKFPKQWEKQMKKVPSTKIFRGKDEKGVYTSKTVGGKEVSRKYETKEEVELDEAQKKLKPSYWRAEWRLGTQSEVDKNNKKIFDKLAKTDPVKAAAFHDNLMRMKNKDVKEEVESVDEADTRVVNKEVKREKEAKATETIINLAKSKKNKVDAKPTLDISNAEKKYVTKV